MTGGPFSAFVIRRPPGRAPGQARPADPPLAFVIRHTPPSSPAGSTGGSSRQRRQPRRQRWPHRRIGSPVKPANDAGRGCHRHGFLADVERARHRSISLSRHPPALPSSSADLGSRPGAGSTGGSTPCLRHPPYPSLVTRRLDRRVQPTAQTAPASKMASPPDRFAGQAGERRGWKVIGWVRRICRRMTVQ